MVSWAHFTMDLFLVHASLEIYFRSFHKYEIVTSKNTISCLALDVSANSICDIHCLVLDGFDLNTVHKLSSKEKKSRWSQDSNPGLLGGMLALCYAAPPPPSFET